MENVVVAVLFCTIAFITGLSLAFNIISKFVDDNKLFSSLKNAVFTYILGTTMASVFTMVSFLCVRGFQNLIH